ncbi:hypothetical protein MMYC01_203930 [Madurella mycetomatis]|uniref:Uncharacterized protein n=1 Tax=Madurella mycetomatis TaxID=100816 RepID=A0A175WBA9_9PEZI|nr:hypothetical protein MMYC01_203930 [Madurella mycetomatis]
MANEYSDSEVDVYIRRVPPRRPAHSHIPHFRAPDIERPEIRDAHYPGPSRNLPVYVINATEFHHVQITTFANRDTFLGILRHYNSNGRGRDVWRSRYKANRFLREEAARSTRHEVRIDTDPRPGGPRPMFFRPGRGTRHSSDDDGSDGFGDGFGRFSGRGPRPGGGDGGMGPDHLYMTAADGHRPARSRDHVVHVVPAEEMLRPERHHFQGARVEVRPRDEHHSHHEERHEERVHLQELRPQRMHTVQTHHADNVRELRPERTGRSPTRKIHLRGGGGKPASGTDIPSYCFMFDRGKPILIYDAQDVDLNWSNKTFVAHLRHQYRALHYGWIMKPHTWVQDIGMIYVLVWVFDGPTRRIKLLNKAELVESPKSGTLSAHDFRYIMDNPPPGKCFGKAVARILQGVRGTRPGRHPQIVLMFEFANLPRTRCAKPALRNG